MVVSVTQQSVNATMKRFLDKVEIPRFTQCFVADDNNSIVEMSYEDVKSRTGGVDPFKIRAGTPVSDPKRAALDKIRFVVGFQTETGLPDFPLDLIPDIIVSISTRKYCKSSAWF